MRSYTPFLYRLLGNALFIGAAFALKPVSIFAMYVCVVIAVIFMVLALLALADAYRLRRPVQGIRAAVCDNASSFAFRMGAGFPGDVNRTHPSAIFPSQIDADHPPILYGNMCVVDSVSHNVRQLVAADQSDATALTPYGAIVRPYPFQQPSAGVNYAAAAFGNATPPTSGLGDFLCGGGTIMVQLNANVTPAVKGGRVFVWCAATAGDHVQGGYETEASAGNTVQLDPRFSYNGAGDSSGVTEILCNV